MADQIIPAKAAGVRTHFFEYCYYRAVEMAPEWTNKALSDPSDHVQPLTTTQARMLRSRVSTLRRNYDDLNMQQSFFRAIDDAFAEHYGDTYRPMFQSIYSPAEGRRFSDSSAWKSLSGHFMGYLGNRPEKLSNGKPNPGARVTGPVRLPVSPYDARFAMRETVLNEGAQLLAITADSITDALGPEALTGDNPSVSAIAQPPRDGVMTTAPMLVRSEPAETGQLREVGETYTQADVMGLAALRPYMTEAEYRKATTHVLAGVSDPATGSVDPSLVMSDAALQRSVAVLDYLTDQGVDYSISPDLRPGQLKARIAGENIDIRLTDTRENEPWVGRVWQAGMSYTYSRGDTGGRDRSAVTPTPQQTVDLVRFARGEQLITDRGTAVGEYTDDTDRRGNRLVYNGSKTTKKLMAYVEEGLYIRMDATNRSPASKFYSPTNPSAQRDAVADLQSYVTSARESFFEQINIRELLADYVSNAGDESFEPNYAGHDEVSALRERYWTQLRGTTEPLIDPRVGVDDKPVSIADILSEESEFSESAYDLADQALDMIDGLDSVADRDMVAEMFLHQTLSADVVIGSYEPDTFTGTRFDPVRVATYMDLPTTSSDKLADVVSALRVADIESQELKGEGFSHTQVLDQLITFDPDTAQSMDEHDDELVRRMGGVVRDTIARRGGELTNAVIDDHGIVSWEATMYTGQKPNGANATMTVRGQLGQIFTQGERGEVITDYASGENFLFVPGYEATVVRRHEGRDGSMESRTRLRGYEHVMEDAVSRAVIDGLAEGRSHVGQPTSINSAMRNVYGYRHSEDFMTRTLEEGMSVEDRDALLETESLRVRYSNELGDGATTLPVMRREARMGGDEATRALALRNDNSRDPLALTDGRNISVLDPEAGAGYFDPVITGTGKNQGLVRYLVPSAVVGEDGYITPGDKDDRVPLAQLEIAQEMGYDPHDRQNMTFSNLLQSTSMVSGVRTAMMQCGGWNFEDGIVVSQEFADMHCMRGSNGELRSLSVGDKLSDMHGNKGVISLVVDPTMSIEEAEACGLEEQVQFFKDNSDVEVIMSPFSPISRFNGGTTREMMENPQDIVVRDNDGNKQVISGGSGELNIIVTHMSVEKKTSIYDAEAVAEGRGRKASSQLAWALQAKGCREIMHDFYGNNSAGVTNAREYLIALGMDLSPTGEIKPEFDHANIDSAEQRNIFGLPEIDINNVAQVRKKFADVIAQSGGFMELPFPLTMANGEQTPAAGTTDGLETYLLPVLSAHLRQEQDLGDGSVSRHDHTKHYLRIHEAVYDYLRAEADGDDAKRNVARNKAQTHYEAIAGDIVSRRIEGKRNMFREGLMNNRRPHSATAVISPDPRLGVNQVAMSPQMARELGVDVDRAGVQAGSGENTQGRYVLGWRDPVLRDGAARYFEVVIDNELTGVAMNPLAAKSMDADYDGDTLGFVGHLSPKAHREAMEKFSMEMNLLDQGVTKTNDAGEVSHPLALHDSLDIQVAMYADPSRRERMDEIVAQLNDFSKQDVSVDERMFVNAAYMNDLNDLYRECFMDRSERITLQFDSMDNHLRSVSRLYETGAKGSEKKLGDYMSYLGAEGDKAKGFVDKGAPQQSELSSKYQDSQLATSYKAQMTGVAGAVSQSQVQVFRVLDNMKVATELTYPVTQAMLQAKHDPVDARYRAETLDGPVRHLWQGHKMDCVVDAEIGRYRWKPVYEDGNPVQATKDEFVDQFQRMFIDERGMGVDLNTEYIREVADLLDDGHGTIIDMNRDNWDQLPAERKPLLLDRLAYNASLDDVIAASHGHESLFDGINRDFAPNVVRRNMTLEQRQLDGDDKALEQEAEVIAAKDTSADYQVKAARSDITPRAPRNEPRVTPSVPSVAPVYDVADDEPEVDDGLEL